MAAVLAGEEAVGHIPWERFVVDPAPGPVPLDSFREVVDVGEGLVLATPRSYVERGGRRFKTQGICVAEALGRSVYVVDAYRRPSEVARALLRFGKVVGIDVGGDVLGAGCEETLGSPLADAFGLAVLVNVAQFGGEAELVVMSPSADGELSRDYVMSRVADAARLGGFLGSLGLSQGQLSLLSRLVERCVTEASAVAVKAAAGAYGELPLRGGVRRVHVDACATVGFRLRPEAVLRLNKAARIVYDADAPVDKAASLLLEHGIPTEYHLEELLASGVDVREAVQTLKAKKRC